MICVTFSKVLINADNILFIVIYVFILGFGGFGPRY